jgi:hypothetical protein
MAPSLAFMIGITRNRSRIGRHHQDSPTSPTGTDTRGIANEQAEPTDLDGIDRYMPRELALDLQHIYIDYVSTFEPTLCPRVD